MTISKEQWQTIEADLAGIFGRAKFQLGDDSLTVERRVVAEGRSQLAVFINGKIIAGWAFTDFCNQKPLVAQVWRKRSRALYSPARRKRMEKTFGKRKAKDFFPCLHESHIYYDPFFTSAKSLVRQYKKIPGLALLP